MTSKLKLRWTTNPGKLIIEKVEVKIDNQIIPNEIKESKSAENTNFRENSEKIPHQYSITGYSTQLKLGDRKITNKFTSK